MGGVDEVSPGGEHDGDAVIQEFDDVVISGYCFSEGRFVYNAKGVVGTAYNSRRHRGTDHWHEIKVWIERADFTTNKLWFDRRFARIRLVSRWMPTFPSWYPDKKDV
jgi:hypothetical protein